MNFTNLPKAMITLVALALIITSCKSDSEKETHKDMSDKTNPYQISLAQWSLHREIETGKLDPFDFPKVAKELGFTAVEWVNQLYEKQIDIFPDRYT